jgi:hypothetical protein
MNDFNNWLDCETDGAMEYSEEDKRLWNLLENDHEMAAKYLAHLQAKPNHKDIVVDDDKINEAEYKCEGDR